MSREFDGVDDLVTATVTAIDSGNVTVVGWIRPDTAGETSAGTIFNIETTGSASVSFVRFLILSTTLRLRAWHTFATTSADTRTTNVIPTAAWTCFVATFRASDGKWRIYLGSQSAPMVEATYDLQQAAAGTRTTAGVWATIGNNRATSVTYDGRIGHVAYDAREWTLVEAEALRLGSRPIQTGTLRGYWPLDSPTASVVEDLSGNGANGTLTGAVVAEEPPVPMSWGYGPFGLLVPSSALTAVGKELDVRWDVRQAVSDASDLRWSTRAAVGDSTDARWNVRFNVGDQADVQWDTRAAVSDQLQSVWNVGLVVGDAADLRWGLRAAVADSIDLRWQVLGALVLVGKELSLRWSTRAAIGDSTVLRWQVASPLVIVATAAVGDTAAATATVGDAAVTTTATSDSGVVTATVGVGP